MKYFKGVVLTLFGLILFFSSTVEARRVKISPQHSYQFLTSAEINKIASPGLSKATFIKDEKGDVFIVYEDGTAFFTAKKLGSQKISGTIQREYLAYLLSKDLCNAAEVRIINKTDAIGTPLEVWMQEKNLTEIGIIRFSQDYQPEDLLYQENTLERMLTLWVWLRDYDHGLLNWNMLTLSDGKEDLYLSYDHDEMATTDESNHNDFSSIVWADIIDLINIHPVDVNVLTNLASYVQSHYSDEKIKEIIEQVGFNKDSEINATVLLDSLILRRDTLINDIEAMVEIINTPARSTIGIGVTN